MGCGHWPRRGISAKCDITEGLQKYKFISLCPFSSFFLLMLENVDDEDDDVDDKKDDDDYSDDASSV